MNIIEWMLLLSIVPLTFAALHWRKRSRRACAVCALHDEKFGAYLADTHALIAVQKSQIADLRMLDRLNASTLDLHKQLLAKHEQTIVVLRLRLEEARERLDHERRTAHDALTIAHKVLS